MKFKEAEGILGGSDYVLSKHVVTPIYKPFRPFGRGPTLTTYKSRMILEIRDDPKDLLSQVKVSHGS